jgi:hypothetical protein
MTDATDALVGTVGGLLVLGAVANMAGHITGVDERHHHDGCNCPQCKRRRAQARRNRIY